MAIKGRILIVEDEKEWQDKLRRDLETPPSPGETDGLGGESVLSRKDTYEVVVVGSYHEAAGALTRARDMGKPFLVVIADLKLPESKDKPALSQEHGKKLLKTLALRYPDIILVIVTGETLSQQEFYEFFPLKVSHFFSKASFDRRAFRRTIDRLVDEARQRMWSLPNHPVIRDQMDSLIVGTRQDENWVVLGVGLSQLDRITERYGFVQCAATLHWVGRLLAEVVDEVAPLAFVSLIPYTDFVIVTTADKIEPLKARILREFSEKVEAIAYDSFELEHSKGEAVPRLSLVFGCISKEDVYEQDIFDIPTIAKAISGAIAQAKRAAADQP
jgi:CheY-like chemotaxis protein